MLDRCGHEEEGLSSLNFQAKLTLSHWEGKLSVSLISSHFKLKRLNTWWVWMTGQGLPSSAAAAKSLQSCPTLCDPLDGSPPSSFFPLDSPGKNTGVGHHFLLQCMKVESESEVAQSCLTLRNPMDCSLPGSPVYGISQARVLEWGAIAFSVHLSSRP